MQVYSDESRANIKTALPDVEIFQLTAREVAETLGDTIYEYMKRPEFQLAAMNSRDREKMFEAMIEEEGIQGGWFYWYCFPGCLPDSEPIGPYDTWQAAKTAMREENEP